MILQHRTRYVFYYLCPINLITTLIMNHLKNLLVFTIILFISGLGIDAQAQESFGGTPPSFIYNDLDSDFEVLTFKAPDMEKIYAEDEVAAQNGGAYRAGVAVIVNKSIENSGTWTDLPDGGKVWRLKLTSPGAQALGVYYDDFWIPFGGELYLYNEAGDQVIGAFTEKSNNPDCIFANQLIQGDKVTLEYYQPANQSVLPNLNISELAYNYRGAHFDYIEKGGSLWCMININCSPEGDNWQDEKRGVVKQYQKIGWGYYFCSGSLINNTEQDLTPYVLTAQHCTEDQNGTPATQSDFNQWIFYYNYEAATCTGNWGPQNYTQTGCQLKASAPPTPGSDFALLEINSNVPTSYNAYFNGWDRRNVPPDSGVNIHHPAGDIKKISTFNMTATSSQWNGYGVLSHWKIWWATTPHGTSITEGGSSGSALFDQNSRIVGDLTGGPPDNCTNPLYSLYGKLSYSWDQNGTAMNQRLKPWLDPINSGVEFWDGTYDGEVPDPAFSVDDNSIQPGETVTFTDHTTSNPLEWEWTFNGGTPSSFTGQNPPEIQYDNPGTYTVTLEASNTIGTGTLDSIDMIVVGGPDVNFTSQNAYIEPGGMVDFTDLTGNDPTGWNWSFPGGNPAASADQNPTGIEYSAVGAYDVKLVATNQYATDSLTKEGFVVVGGPFADFEADNTSIVAGESVTFTDLSTNNPTNWVWKFFGGSPGAYTGQDPPAITYNNEGTYTVKLTVSNDLGSNTLSLDNYINVGGVGITENVDESVIIYPNPSKGKVNLKLNEQDNIRSIVVYNALGLAIMNVEHSSSKEVYELNLSDQPDGMYFLRVEFNDRVVNNKIYLAK